MSNSSLVFRKLQNRAKQSNLSLGAMIRIIVEESNTRMDISLDNKKDSEIVKYISSNIEAQSQILNVIEKGEIVGLDNKINGKKALKSYLDMCLNKENKGSATAKRKSKTSDRAA